MAVHAPCETFIKNVTKVLWEGRRAGARYFYIIYDLNVELGLLMTVRSSMRCMDRFAGKDVTMIMAVSRS